MTRRAHDDPRELPTYGVSEAAHYLRIPTSTLQHWLIGQAIVRDGRVRRTPAVIQLASRRPPMLSFWNLAEAYVLATIRRRHHVSLQKVRKALRYVEQQLEVERPLLHQQFLTDGVHLFVEQLGRLINASQEGQLAMSRLLAASLERVQRDPRGLIARIFPWASEPSEPLQVEIDPRRAYGRLVVAGTGIPTEEIAQRMRAGDGVAELAKDFRLEASQIEAALRWELRDTTH